MASPASNKRPMPPAPPAIGVEIAGTGVGLPEGRLTNADLERMMDTSDEWIRQRTGIRERRMVSKQEGQSARTLCKEALAAALDDAGVAASELDLVIVATVSMEMPCPSTACRVASEVGAGDAGALDLVAACCGFVYAINVASAMIRAGAHKTVGVIGCDVLSQFMDYSTAGRGTAILFGDAAGAAVLRATDDVGKGIIAQSMHADGGRWCDLYIPQTARDFPEGHEPDESKINVMQMNGREVFRFAVKTFPDVIQQTLDMAGVAASDVSQFVCHQSNARILEAARERFGLPPEKMYVNIDRFGNTSAGSVPICLHELRTMGRIKPDDLIMLVAFGGGLTWASSLWRV